jgi:hypothetical protein
MACDKKVTPAVKQQFQPYLLVGFHEDHMLLFLLCRSLIIFDKQKNEIIRHSTFTEKKTSEINQKVPAISILLIWLFLHE